MNDDNRRTGNGGRGPQQRPNRTKGSRPVNGRPPQGRPGTGRKPSQNRSSASGKRPAPERRPQTRGNARPPMSPKQRAAKKRKKIIAFVAEIFTLLLLLIVLWGVLKVKKVNYIEINENDIEIDEQVQQATETGSMKNFWNIALFGVDSRDGELDKSTRTDTIMIASINMDTKEVKLVSVYRDTYLNLGTDAYNKANSAYAKGGPKQAINMLNMNMDMNITDFVTIGFDGLIDVIDAVGGVEINVTEAEISYLNDYQISMVGTQSGTNAKGEPNYVATAGKDYTPVKTAGTQTLNGLQATAYCRIRHVGNDFQRTQRQRTVLEKVAKKAMTLNPSTLNKIAEAVFPKIATSLKLEDILQLLGGIADYKIGDSCGFPFDDHLKTGNVGSKGSCVVPIDLEQNVILLHEFFFKEEDYEPSETVKACSQKISSDTSKYIK